MFLHVAEDEDANMRDSLSRGAMGKRAKGQKGKTKVLYQYCADCREPLTDCHSTCKAVQIRQAVPRNRAGLEVLFLSLAFSHHHEPNFHCSSRCKRAARHTLPCNNYCSTPAPGLSCPFLIFFFFFAFPCLRRSSLAFASVLSNTTGTATKLTLVCSIAQGEYSLPWSVCLYHGTLLGWCIMGIFSARVSSASPDEHPCRRLSVANM